MKTSSITLATLGALSLATTAHAGTVFDSVDSVGVGASYTFNYTAVASSTTIGARGYNIPSFDNISDITLTSGSSGNLLGQIWDFVPAASGSDSSQSDDGAGTGTNGLGFGGVVAGFYDTYSQSITTTPGELLTLNFTYAGSSAPADVQVAFDSFSASVPEPATWAMMLLGFGMIGFAARALRQKVSVTYA